VWLLVATCGGIGRLPTAPGTWGSLAAVVFTVVLQVPFYPLLLAVGFVASAWICGQVQRVLQDPDPKVVVLDEFWAVVALVSWSGSAWQSSSWGLAFLLFRVFDIAKPFPLRWLERLPGGWGIMADDAGAALYSALVIGVLRMLPIIPV
jgi:phosphatidylglycerophosphatase A